MISVEDFASLSDTQKINVRMVQNLTSLNTAINNLQDDFRELQMMQQEHDKILIKGNGVPSLQERLRNVEGFIHAQKQVIRIIGGAILLQVITFIAAAAIAFARIVPILEQISRDLP